MKILTVSASPYMLTRLGRLHKSIILDLLKGGYEVCSAVWHHDKNYYTNDEIDKKYYFEHDGEKQNELVLISTEPTKAIASIYDLSKKFNPDVVVSIGDYHETDYISAIKSVNPKLFKWVAVLTIASGIEPTHKNQIDHIDYALISTRQGLRAFRSLSPSAVDWVPVGYDSETFYTSPEPPGTFRIMANLKNSQSCNPVAFLAAIKVLKSSCKDIEAYLHTNIDEDGDYCLRDVIEDFGLLNIVSTPKKFVTNQHGISDENLRQEYSKSAVIVDPSMKSATAISLLEGMGCGCFPLATKIGALEDVLTPWESNFIYSNSFIGEKHQKLEIINSDSLAERLIELYKNFKKAKDKKDFFGKYTCRAKEFSRKVFLEKLKDAISKIVEGKEAELAVDVLV